MEGRLFVLAACSAVALSAAGQTIRVDTAPGAAANSFVPKEALGAGYLTRAFTGEDDSLHPQWITVDLAGALPVNAIRVAWAEPFASPIPRAVLDR